jgi:hypothetical protein
MPIDSKDPSSWIEADLQELCDERRRESQKLEFKGDLVLDRERQKLDVERDAQGMACGGGGVIVYGISEIDLPDGGRGAGHLTHLTDGSLYERLRDVLDSRGHPRLLFDLHAVVAVQGGFYLVLNVSGRRRPHQGQDGRYYGRRGTSTRPLDETEVAEAYRERFLREAQAIQRPTNDDPTGALPPDVADRIHRGLTPGELAVWRDDTGEREPPGWLSVVVYPEPRQSGLLDPVRDAERFHETLAIPDQWDPDHLPLQYFYLQPGLNGLRAQLPPTDERPPAYLVSMFRDGIMEYGTTLESALRRDNPAENRIIFSASHAYQAHDYLQAFAVALGRLGYDGPTAAQVSFENTHGVSLGVARERLALTLHPIEDQSIRGGIWRGRPSDLLDAAGLVVKQVMDLVFLAAGVSSGCWMIDNRGRRATA